MRNDVLRLVLAGAVVAAVALACEEAAAPPVPEPPGPAPSEPAPATDAERRAADSAREAAQELGRTLKTRLLAAMADGPASAAAVCSAEAPAIAARIAEARGAQIGRSSGRLRNPENRGPAWVRAWLDAQGERSAEGLAPVSTIADGRARFLAPIAIEGPCLACHGPAEGIAPEVRALLAERYPTDRATGYALGDLRGALWAEVDVR